MIPLKKVTEKKSHEYGKILFWNPAQDPGKGRVDVSIILKGSLGEKKQSLKKVTEMDPLKKNPEKNPVEDSKMCKESWKEPSEIGQKSRNPELMETDPDGMPGMLEICRRIISKWSRIAKRFEVSPRILENPCGSLKIRELGQNMCNNLQRILKNRLKHHSKSWKIPRILKDP